MLLTLKTTGRGNDSTGGELYIGDRRECFTCEDEIRGIKVPGETAIPEGTYRIKLRADGGMHQKYAERYPFHRGMLHLQDVPGFQWIYIHTGNTEKHTEGCILVGTSRTQPAPGEFGVSGSRQAYERLYKKILAAMDRDQHVFIEVTR